MQDIADEDMPIGVIDDLIMVVQAFKSICKERGNEWVLQTAKRMFMKNVNDPLIFGDIVQQIIGHSSIDIIKTYSQANADTFNVFKYGVAHLVAYSEKLAERDYMETILKLQQLKHIDEAPKGCQVMDEIGEWMTQKLKEKFPDMFKDIKNPVVTQSNDVFTVTDGKLVESNYLCNMSKK